MRAAARSLDLLVVNPAGRERIYQKLGERLAAIEPPVWAGLLAEHARTAGRSVEVLDANALELTAAETAARVVEADPLLVVVVVYGHNPNASTQVMPGAGKLCREIRRADPTARILLVGGHVAALPERTLREEAADFTCDGEGPYTISDLVEALRAGGGPRELERVRGLCWREGGIVRRNPPAPLVTDLDREMAGVAFDLLPVERYRAHNWHCFGGRQRRPYAAVYTTLGCPFRCTFCCIQAPFKRGEEALGLPAARNSYRRWSPRTVVRRLADLAERHGVANVKIADELFVLHRAHVEGVCEGLIETGYDWNVWAYARADTCGDDRLLARMRQAGVRWLAIGIESASRRVRDDVDKGYRPEDLTAAIERVRGHGIHVIANYVFGLPEDDHETMRETLELAKELNTEFANFFSAMAYPGSRLYEDALREGWRLPDGWEGYSQHSRSCLPLPTRHVSAEEVLAFRDRAFQEYFRRPEYLALVERTFGPETVAEIRDMVAQPLPRDHAAPAPAVRT